MTIATHQAGLRRVRIEYLDAARARSSPGLQRNWTSNVWDVTEFRRAADRRRDAKRALPLMDNVLIW